MKLLLACLILTSIVCAQEDHPACRVYVDGIWDLFHSGHTELFRQAKEKALQTHPNRKIQLIVGVCGTPEEVAIYKRPTIMTLAERAAAVQSCPLVDEIIYQAPVFGFDEVFLNEHKIDLVVHGDDFSDEAKEKYYGVAIKLGKFATVPYTKGVSTTELIAQAETTGKIIEDLGQTKLKKNELISRIQNRSKNELSR